MISRVIIDDSMKTKLETLDAMRRDLMALEITLNILGDKSSRDLTSKCAALSHEIDKIETELSSV